MTFATISQTSESSETSKVAEVALGLAWAVGLALGASAIFAIYLMRLALGACVTAASMSPV
jgi:hypothetical protein